MPIPQPTSRPRRLKEAIAVLDLLADFPHLEKIVERWSIYDRSLSIIGHFAIPITSAIGRDLYEKEVWKSEESLIQAAEMLFTNTDLRGRVPKTCSFDDYFRYFTGSNIRWEALCVFFTACGLCCNCLRCDEPYYDFVGQYVLSQFSPHFHVSLPRHYCLPSLRTPAHNHLTLISYSTEDDRQDFMYKLMQASNACISFCEDAGQLSDLALWALLENGIYNSQVLGDAHYLTWRKIGDVSTAIFAQGLHQESKDISKLPFWVVEMRRRALGSAYSIDKLLCTFVGRPPRISQRYCSIQIPLDLEFTELALEGAELEAALATIGANGWNTNTLNMNRKSLYARCFVLCALLREEVLELSLGPPQDNMLEKATDIIARNQSLMEALPEYIRFRPGMWNRDARVSFYSAQEYLDILYNEFMLRRAMVRQLRDDPSDLLNIAQKILSAVLEASTTRFARTTNAACVPWMAVLVSASSLPTFVPWSTPRPFCADERAIILALSHMLLISLTMTVWSSCRRGARFRAVAAEDASFPDTGIVPALESHTGSLGLHLQPQMGKHFSLHLPSRSPLPFSLPLSAAFSRSLAHSHPSVCSRSLVRPSLLSSSRSFILDSPSSHPLLLSLSDKSSRCTPRVKATSR